MAFSSIPFLCAFLPTVFLLYCVTPSIRWKNRLLLAASLLFYAYGEPVSVFLMVACALVNYAAALAFCRFGGGPNSGHGQGGGGKRKAVLILAVAADLGLLCFYKYTGMLVEALDGLLHWNLPVPHIRLPIGISFFTFQALSYTVDVYRGRVGAEKRFSKVLLYISFFPQLIAGPIIKYVDVEQQIDAREMSAQKVAEGLRRFILGLSKKVLISNTMGVAADYVYGLPSGEVGMATAWTGAIAYMLQIYFDFSGYSDMAIGLGRMFGFSFKENFRYPYTATSMQDFWRRWHISLTDWFRDYLYIPLGGNRKGKARTWINRLIVFFCTGLWHGANWTFVVWGLYHGFFLTLETLAPRKEGTGRWGWLRHLSVPLVVCVGFVLFRAQDMGQAGRMLRSMFFCFSWSPAMAAAFGPLFSGLFLATLPVAVLGSTRLLPELCRRLGGKSWSQPLSYVFSLGLLALCVMSLAGGTYNPFIYFRF